jgi:PAS domain S-box-containing protein
MNALNELRLCDVASMDVVCVTPDTPLVVAIEIFFERRISSLIVAEDNKPVGIITEHDLVFLISQKPVPGALVSSLMTHPLMTTRFDLGFYAAQLAMANRGVRHLVLVDNNGFLKGVASETDFCRHLDLSLFEGIQGLAAIADQSRELISPDELLSSVLQTMSLRWLDHVIIGRNGQVQGILTERDIPRLLMEQIDPSQMTVGQVMSQPLINIMIDLLPADAVRHMELHGLRHLILVDEHGVFAGVLTQHRILERISLVMLEQSRRSLAERLDLVLESTGVGTWEYDHQREVLIRSVALNRLMRFSPDDAYQKLEDVLSRAHPDEREMVESIFRGMLQGVDEQFSMDYRAQGGDGKMHWLTVRGRVVDRDSAGRPLRTAGVGIDIDRQKTSEIALQKSDAHFRDLIENIPLPVLHIDSQRRVLFLNQQFIETFGYTAEDIPTVDAWNLLAYPDEKYRAWGIESWQAACDRVVGTKQVIRPPDRRVVCKNGQEKMIEISGVSLGESMLVTLIDETERYQQQASLAFGHEILRLISTGTLQADVLSAIVRQFEMLTPGVRGSVFLLDAEANCLRHGAAPHLPEAFCQAIDGVKIGPAAGSCGTAAYLKVDVFTGDIAHDPLWTEFRDLALSHGLAACWSSPIISTTGKLLGALALYWHEPMAEVSQEIRQHIAQATALAAIALERFQREAALHGMVDELRRWQDVMLGREGRVLELKREVNALLQAHGQPPRYQSVEDAEGRAS